MDVQFLARSPSTVCIVRKFVASHLVRLLVVFIVPRKPTEAGDPCSPWTFRICEWPWTRETKAAESRTRVREDILAESRGG